MRWFKSFAFLMVLLLLGGAAHGATILVGEHNLLPDTPGQTIQIFVTGGNAVQGLNFNGQVADGGPEVGGSIDGPNITSADILTGTIFGSNNTGQQDPGSFPQLAIRTTSTSSGTVTADGLLATLSIDTTGFLKGSWPLKLGDTLNGPTDFAGIPITITDGSIAVPEPAGAALLLIAGAGVTTRRRRC
jgi:hypothetical protein